MMNMNRLRRHLLDIFGTHSINTHSVSGSHNQINMPSGNSELTKMNDSPGQSGRQLVNEVMGTSGELIRTPLAWIKDIQTNWLIYLILGAIICLSMLYLYCAISKCFNRKQNTQIDPFTLATIIEKHQNRSSIEFNQKNPDRDRNHDREKY